MSLAVATAQEVFENPETACWLLHASSCRDKHKAIYFHETENYICSCHCKMTLENICCFLLHIPNILQEGWQGGCVHEKRIWSRDWWLCGHCSSTRCNLSHFSRAPPFWEQPAGCRHPTVASPQSWRRSKDVLEEIFNDRGGYRRKCFRGHRVCF